MLTNWLVVGLTALPLCTARGVQNIKRQSSDVGQWQYINTTEFNSNSSPVELSIAVNGGGRNQTAPLLYGWMHEDISHSGDGGIYGELVVNRAFQGSGSTIGLTPGVPGNSIISSENPILPFGPVLTGWQPVGDALLSLTLLHPLSDTLPIALELDILANATGEVGFYNEGFWGMDVHPGMYNASFYILGSHPRSNNTVTGINVSLRSNLTGEVWASTTIPVSSESDGTTNTTISTFQWHQLAAQIENTVSAPNSNNSFYVTFNASEVAGFTFYFNLISLFPETYNNLPNGLRKDLGEVIANLGTKFLRFPGGNNLEGYSIEQRWIWNETIGPLTDRRSRVGNWGYVNTNGLGLLEYLEFCESAGIEPLLAVYAGFSLDIWGQDGPSYPQDQMGLVLQDILNELEYITGDVGTPYGALRASHGHPAPFVLNYVELGNEDWFSYTYNYRFPILYNGIKAVYPNLTLISTAYNENLDYNITIPAGGMWDTHHYEEPSYFLEHFDYWDNWQEATNNTDVTIFIGEYSVFQADTPSGTVNYSNPLGTHVFFPSLLAALGEGVYLLGAERNPNVVKMTSYAPSFMNLNWQNWTPDLVAFTADWNQTVLSASYYLQQMFASYRGTETVPVTTVQGDYDPLWWVSTIDTIAGEMYFKVINSGNSSVPLTIDLDIAYTSVNGTILTYPNLMDYNYLNNQTAISPKPITSLPNGAGQKFSWSVPAFSVNVLQFDLS